MIVLDIDLDFFLSEITRPPSENRKRQDDCIVPWSEIAVREFLEDQCRLSQKIPCPGSTVETHDEVFWHWRKLLEKGELVQPFEVVHVDAHADLGVGCSSTAYICTELLSHRAEERPYVAFQNFDEATYLAFAIACRWVSCLRYVHHPGLPLELGDVPPQYLRDGKQDADILQLKRYSRKELKANFWEYQRATPLAMEPTVRFQRIPANEYYAKARPDFVFVAHSPKYTPSSADPLLDVMRSYIRPNR